jgi:hypothetical protein
LIANTWWAGGEQRLHPRTAAGPDPDQDLPGVVQFTVVRADVAQVLPDQLVQQRNTGHPSDSRRRTSRRPVSSWTPTSWWASAQSSPHEQHQQHFLALDLTIVERAGRTASR